jgi:DNA-directed RNA polymerase alpha subunit
VNAVESELVFRVAVEQLRQDTPNAVVIPNEQSGDWLYQWFDTRIGHVLEDAGICTRAQIERTSNSELLRLKNFGQKSVARVRAQIPFVGKVRAGL